MNAAELCPGMHFVWLASDKVYSLLFFPWLLNLLEVSGGI